MDDPEADRRCWHTARTCNKGHGRLEKRTLVATTELNEFLARDWAEVGQVFRLERTVLQKDVWHTTLVYGLTSLSPTQASPERLLELNRGHWGIGAIRFAEMSTQLKDGEQGGEKLLDN